MSRKEGGAFWKRQKIRKQEKLNKILEKNQRLDAYFKPSVSTSTPSNTPQESSSARVIVCGIDAASDSTCAKDADVSFGKRNLDPLNDVLEKKPIETAETSNTGTNTSDTKQQQEHQLVNEEKPKQSCSLIPLSFQPQGFITLDPAKWDIKNEAYVNHVINNFKSQDLETLNFLKSKREGTGSRQRYCRKSHFFKQLKNGESIRRHWIAYSESTGNIFCLYCKLFSQTRNSVFASLGFSTWAKVTAKCNQHERSPQHIKSVEIFLKRKSSAISKIDESLQIQIKNEMTYWRDILKRILSVIKFLALRSLPFRGSVETFGSDKNGNYLGLLELVSEYDPLLKQHIEKYGSKGAGSVSYLSKNVCYEFLEILSQTVITEITKQIKRSKYYSISVDSTPDIKHVDQLTFIIRYCTDAGIPVERFVTFLENVGHKSENMQDAILNLLQKMNLDIKNCRGQSYDNASNMSGIYNGLQAKIKAQNSLAIFVPCAAHSLNLVIKSAAECCLEATSFFIMIEDLYVFFSSSTNRWLVLTDILKHSDIETGFVLKRVNVTRWSSRHEAVKTIRYCYKEIQKSLETLFNNTCEKSEVRAKAKSFWETFTTLEFGILVVFWYQILERANKVSKTLQEVDVDLGICSSLYCSLKEYYLSLREKFEFFQKEGEILSEEKNFKTNKRIRKRKLQYGEAKTEAVLNEKDNMRIKVFYRIIDQIASDLSNRGNAYEEATKPFLFLFSLKTLTESEILEGATELKSIYSGDLDDYFNQECIHFQKFIISLEFQKEIQGLRNNAKDLMVLLHQHNIISTFPNIEVALRIFLTLMVSNASGERSFSTLKRTKNYLRNSLVQQRLNSYSILHINGDLLNELDFDSVINTFAETKSRKIGLK